MPGLKHHLIGLCGYAGAGKDTVADLLVTHAGFRKLAFADALKAEITEAFHVEPLVFIRSELKTRPLGELALSRTTERGYVDAVLRHMATTLPAGFAVNEELTRPRTPRETMQLWGTEYRRAHDDQYWTRKVAQRIYYYTNDLGEHNLVVTDCRFANEVDALRTMGGLLWQVRRPGVDAGGPHSSATDGSDYAPDAVISNSHDIKHLQQLVLGEYWAVDAGLDKVEVSIP
ncbi:MAG: hypothetical protein QG643_2429 [Pseudomonadota bacterium]|nr:hypothetical protein [Pseudomonadota bacterium]